MADYQLITNSAAVLRRADSATIPPDPGNRDRQIYLTWLSEGNTPDPPAPPSRAGVIAQSAQALSLDRARTLNRQGRIQEAVDAILDHMEPKA